MSFDVATIKKDFPIFEREINGKPIVFLDSAASSQKPRAVIDSMSHYYEFTHANVHRGVYSLSEEATALYESARAKISSFINSPSSDQVIITKNVTEAINLVAYSWGRANLRAGDVVVITELEHHANIVPWQMLAEQLQIEIRFVGLTPDGRLDLTNIDQLLDGAKLFTFAAVSNVLGTINPVAELTNEARARGVTTLVDFAQWTPHIATDVVASGADFVAFTGHKMCGPTGVGILWGRRELLETMPCFMGGGDMILDVRLDGFVPNQLPWKFEAGTPPIAEVIGLGAAVDYLNNIGMASIAAHERALSEYALQALPEMLGNKFHVFGPQDAASRSGVLSFAYKNIHPHDISQVLDEHNVCVRAGHHCAKPLMRVLGQSATARASFYIYNDTADIDALGTALQHAANIFD